ncbi:MAG: YeeE/YedE thiosulfate transporter family protein [Pseudodonghicola sp.]|nr:YeeE/YedE thiosulfate transporter family protein [Pseudodonghicola sp.]
MGAILGFAAHRAGLCTVKAAAEVLTSRRGHFLWSFAKSAAWVMALTAVVGAFGHPTSFTHWPLTGLSVLGGVLFGVGAGLNGGCTFSTLTRAVDGNIGLWLTVAAWPIGMSVATMLPLPHPRPVVVAQPSYSLGIVLLLGLALLWEGTLILRRFWRKHGVKRVLGASVYTLSAGAALVGLSNAVIIEATGPWSFSSTILCGIGTRSGTNCAHPMLAWAILGAAILGMAFSSLQRGSFGLNMPRAGAALRHGAGGMLMGMGTVLVPGGNDGLILFAIPSLSPHAIPAYSGLFAGILATLSLMRAFGRQIPPVLCSGDICRVRSASPRRADMK